ncbi:MAG: inorganic diphosphatase [Candidatus Nealsonbacteria bacterium]|nr:inorganic diphosphatase [Candidatus Nealsonbacteria bacterium]
MINLFKDIPAGENPPENINVIVENIKGSKNKIEYEKEGFFKLDRTCYSPFSTPFEYGFIPQTESGDGDALDVILLVTHSTFPGCLIKSRPIGLLLMEDEEGEDSKIIAVPDDKVDPRFKEIRDIKDVGQHLKDEIEIYFADYKKLEKEKYKYVKVKGWEGSEKAKKLIKEGIASYKK